MNPLTMVLRLNADEKSPKQLASFIARLDAKMEGRLHAKEDTFTLAYVIAERIRRMLLGLMVEGALSEVDPEDFEFELSYDAAAALAYELKTYPKRPKTGLLPQIMSQLEIALREKKQNERDRKRTAKRRDRPTVRESRGL